MIPSSPPSAGSVIRYRYLWKREAEDGLEEGAKDRPVALIVAHAPNDGTCIVVPITHSPPDDPAEAIEIPTFEKRRLGLDRERSWIVLTEINAFVWPGPDLRPVPDRDPRTVVYGAISKGLYAEVLARLQALVRARRVRPVPRTD